MTDSAGSVVVVYSPRAREVCEVHFTLPAAQITVGELLQRSGILANMGPDQADQLACGIWGRKVALSHVVRTGDRLELYRPLMVDPKIARRERFVRQGARSAGLFAKRRTGAKAGY